jgi:mannose-6-phosphate isomerase-like protein (cupin superfamily)
VSERPSAIVVPPGAGHRVANIEFLARSEDTPRFNLGILTVEPGSEGPGTHAHDTEDDSFYILDGEITFTVEGEEIVAGPGTFVLVPPGTAHGFANRGERRARVLNVHAPAGFDRRIAGG